MFMFGGDQNGGFYGGSASQPSGSDRMPTCRVCSQKFASFPELKQHIREENHHDVSMTKPAATPNPAALNPAASSFYPGANNTPAVTPFAPKAGRKASFDKSFSDTNFPPNNKSPDMNPFSSGFNSTSTIPPRDKNVVNTQLFPWDSKPSSFQDSSIKLNPFTSSSMGNNNNNNNNNNNPFVKSILKSGHDDHKGENRHVNFKLNSSPDKPPGINATSSNVTMNPSFNPFSMSFNQPNASSSAPSSDAQWKRQGTPAHGAIMKPKAQFAQELDDQEDMSNNGASMPAAPRVKLKAKIKKVIAPSAPDTDAQPIFTTGKKLSPRKEAVSSSGGSEKWICRHCDVQCASSDDFEAHNRSMEHETTVRKKLRALKKQAAAAGAGATPAKSLGQPLSSIREESAAEEDDDDADGGGAGDYSDWDDSNSGSIPFPVGSLSKSALKGKRSLRGESDGEAEPAPKSALKSSIASRLGLPTTSSVPNSKRQSTSSVDSDSAYPISAQQSPFPLLPDNGPGYAPGGLRATPTPAKQLFDKTPFLSTGGYDDGDGNKSMEYSQSTSHSGFAASSYAAQSALNDSDITEPDVSPLAKSRLSSSFTPAARSETRSSGAFTSHAAAMSNEDESSGAGTCVEMCPEEERVKRDREIDVHVYEKPENLPWGAGLTLSDTMIKKFQRSSADHELQIPHLVRTPETLLQTINYMETYIMDQLEEEPWSLSRYLFIWDRYRMIAKDFILQTSTLQKTGLWIECHERMARWYVLMDHRMKASEEYQGGHAQQNLESLNNLLKTLDGYYNNPLFVESSSSSQLLRNQGEFYSYFVLVQLGNTDFITKFIQSIPSAAFATDEMKMALKVAGVLKRGEYAQFFRLLQEATPLQASLMHKYVADVRFDALSTLARGLVKQTYYPISHLIDLLMLEGDEEALEFLEHCGIEVATGEGEEGPCAVLEQQSVLRLLPVDKNGTPVKPRAWYMGYWIDARLEEIPTSEVCRGPEDRRVSIKDLAKPLSESSSTRISVPAKTSSVADNSAKKVPKRLNAEATEFVTKPPVASPGVPSPVKPASGPSTFQLNMPSSGPSSPTPSWPSTTLDLGKKAKRPDESLADADAPSKTKPPLNLAPKSSFTFPSQSLQPSQTLKPPADGVAGEKLKEQADAEAKALAEAKAAEAKAAVEKAAQEKAAREKAEEEKRLARERELQEKERLRQLELEKQRQREAEEARAREEAAERERQRLLEIERERERERQRILDEQRREQEREQSLVPTQDSLHQVAKLKVTRAVFSNWRHAFHLSQEKSRLKLMKLFFASWKRAIDKQTARRQKLLETLHNAQTRKIHRQGVASETNTLKLKLKSLREHRQSFLDFDDVMYRNVTAPSQVFPLFVVRNTLNSEFNSLATRFSPVATTGPALLSIQSKKLRSIPGLSLPPRSFLDASRGTVDAAWRGSVFYKVALLSMCAQTGQWKDADSYLWNLLRVVLTSVNRGDASVFDKFRDSSPLLTGLWSGTFHDPQNEELTGSGSVSVVDICTDSSSQLLQLPKAIKGVSTAFVFLPVDLLELASEPKSLPRLQHLLDSLRLFIDNGTYLSLLVTEEVFDSQLSSSSDSDISFTSVDVDDMLMSSASPADDDASAKVLMCVQVIQRLLNNDSFLPLLQQAFLVQLRTPTEETGGSRRALFNVTPPMLSHHALLAYECAQQALMQSAREAAAFPLLRKLDLFSWLEARLLSAVWSTLPGTLRAEDLSLEAIVAAVNDALEKCKHFLFENHAKLQDMYSATGFPAPEFISAVKSTSKLGGCLYVSNPELGGDDTIAADWHSESRLVASIQLLEKFSLPTMNQPNSMDGFLSELRDELGWSVSSSMPRLSRGPQCRRLVSELLRSRRVQLEETLDRACHLIYVPLSADVLEKPVSQFRLPFEDDTTHEQADSSSIPMQMTSAVSSSEQAAYDIGPASKNMDTTDSVELTSNEFAGSVLMKSGRSVGEHLAALLKADPAAHTAQIASVHEQVSGELEAQGRLEALLASALLGGNLGVSAINGSDTGAGGSTAGSFLAALPNKENVISAMSANIKRSNTKRGFDDLDASEDQDVNEGAIISTGEVQVADTQGEATLPQSSSLKQVHEYLKRCRKERQEFDAAIRASIKPTRCSERSVYLIHYQPLSNDDRIRIF